jgi:putative ABC transport system permease protein
LFGALYPAWQSSRFPLIQVVRSGFRRGKEIHVKQRIRSAFFLFIVTVGCFFISVQYSSLSFCYVGIFLLLFTVIEIAPLVVGLIVTLLGRYQDSSNGLKKLLVVRTISGYLAVGQIGESVRASARGIAIAAVGVALMVGVEGMVTSFRLSLLDWMERTFAADIYISSTTQSTMNAVNTLPKIVEQRLKEFPYVKSLQPSITYTVPLGELLISVTGILFEAKEMQKAYQLKSGRYPNSKNYVFELVASTSALRRLINDFTRDRGTLFINYDVLTSITSAESPETIGVFLNTVSEVLEVKENLKQIFKDFNLRFTDSFELKRSVEKLFNDTFRITDILQVIIGALGGIGFFTNVFQHLLERRHRYSLLRTMGVRVRELMIALIIEVVLVLVPALGAGAFVGVVLSSILVLIVNPLAFGWDLNLIISSSQILVPVIVMGCSALASTLAALLWCFPPPSACRDMH